jgi:hypothetical protein
MSRHRSSLSPSVSFSTAAERMRAIEGEIAEILRSFPELAAARRVEPMVRRAPLRSRRTTGTWQRASRVIH